MSDAQMIKKIDKCRVCGNSTLVPIISLGSQYVSDFINSESEHTISIPLDLVLCEEKSGGCGLLQLVHTTPPEIMYSHYWYLSGLNESMRMALADITESAVASTRLSGGDMVLDIGCNDGTLLRSYKVKGLQLVGIDPAKNLPQYSSVGTSKIINDYFSAAAVRKHFPTQKMKVITAIAMFYDLDDPNAFVSGVADLLDSEGVFIIQMSYLPSMLEANAFDNICHEHLEYYSLRSLENLLSRHGLEVFDVTLNDVNGGSFRVFSRLKGSRHIASPQAKERVARLREKEKMMKLDERQAYLDFSARVQDVKDKVVDFITNAKADGKKVFVYGASTKGNTLLQTFNIKYPLIDAAAERNPEKYGKKTVGTLIPIISEEEARKLKPDYFLVLPWHFLDTFLEREHAFLKDGGKFIVPLPQFRVIGIDDIM